MGVACSSVCTPGTNEVLYQIPSATAAMTIVVHTVSGDVVLGPEEYPCDVKTFQLQADVLATAIANRTGANLVQLLQGDRVLREDESITQSHGQEVVSLNCVLRKGVYINASCSDAMGNWSIAVKPLSDDVDVEVWLRTTINKQRQVSSGADKMTGSDLLANVEPLLVRTQLMQDDWEQLKVLMQQATSGEYLEMEPSTGPFPREIGFRAAVAGHGITFQGAIADPKEQWSRQLAEHFKHSDRLIIGPGFMM